MPYTRTQTELDIRDATQELEEKINRTITQAIMTTKGDFDLLKKSHQKFIIATQREVKHLNSQRDQMTKAIVTEAIEKTAQKYNHNWLSLCGKLGKYVRDVKKLERDMLDPEWSMDIDALIEDIQEDTGKISTNLMKLQLQTRALVIGLGVVTLGCAAIFVLIFLKGINA